MKIILTGATGMSGAQVLREMLADKDISSIVLLSRRPCGVSHPRLTEKILPDFTDYADCAALFKNAQAMLWCLGVSQNDVSKNEYIRITVDYALAAAKAFFEANPAARFCFLSGQGSDQTEQSRFTFAKYKGRTERLLTEAYGANVYHFKPGYIKPTVPRKPLRIVELIFNPLLPLIGLLTKSFSTTSHNLALAMIHVAKHGSGTNVFNNEAINWLAAGEAKPSQH